MIIFSLLQTSAKWRIFQRMGNQGWAALIPLYNTFVLYRTLYGSGWRMLLQRIPIYGLYVSIKFCIDLADSFHKSTGFGWGLYLLQPIFICILGFGSGTYLDGSAAIVSGDVISRTLDAIANDVAGKKVVCNDDMMEMLAELAQLHKDGILTDEEFQQKKAEWLKYI